MTTNAIQTSRGTAADADPFRYGWRFELRPTPDDPHHLEQVPLTLEDVLHPEVGDFIVHNDRHETDRIYLTEVLRARLEASGAAIVLTDVRIVWDIPGLRAHGPDVMVIPGIAERQNWSTFDVAVEGARPALIIETSLRANDFARVEQTLAAIDEALAKAYVRAAEADRDPITQIRYDVGSIREDLYLRPEGMDSRLARVRQAIMTLIEARQ